MVIILMQHIEFHIMIVRGIADCSLPHQVLEECGFDVPVSAVKPVTSYVSATGISGSKHSMFFVEVDEGMRVTGGGGEA